MIQFPPLFASKAPEIVGRSLVLAELETAQRMREARQMCLDYYHNEILVEDGGKDAYLRDFFRAWDAERQTWIDAAGVVLEHVPLTEQLNNLKARNYLTQPARKIRKDKGKPESATKYEDLLRRSGWALSAKAAERYTGLLGDIAVGVFWNEDKEALDFVIAPEYYPYFAEDDPLQLDPVAIVYPTALRGKNGEVLWVYMDAEKKLTLTAGMEKQEEEDNVYGILNWFFPHREKPVLSFYGSPRKSLIMANQAIDVAKTALNKLMRYNGWKQLVTTGKVDPNVGRDFVLGNSTVLSIQPGGEASDIQPTAEPLDMQADFRQHIDAIKFGIDSAAQMLNMAFDWKMDGAGVKSGRALEVQNVKDYEDRKGQIEVVIDQYERPLHRIAVAVAKSMGQSIEDGELIVDFPEPEQGFPSATDEIAWRTHEMAVGLRTPVDYMLEDNPDMTEEEAVAKLENNLKVNRLIAGGAGTEDDINAILRDMDADRGNGNQGAPGATGQVAGAGEDGRGGIAAALAGANQAGEGQ